MSHSSHVVDKQFQNEYCILQVDYGEIPFYIHKKNVHSTLKGHQSILQTKTHECKPMRNMTWGKRWFIAVSTINFNLPVPWLSVCCRLHCQSSQAVDKFVHVREEVLFPYYNGFRLLWSTPKQSGSFLSCADPMSAAYLIVAGFITHQASCRLFSAVSNCLSVHLAAIGSYELLVHRR